MRVHEYVYQDSLFCYSESRVANASHNTHPHATKGNQLKFNQLNQ